MKKNVIFIIFAIITYCNSFGQFSIYGEYRPRGEFRHGYKQLADDSLSKIFKITSPKSTLLIEA